MANINKLVEKYVKSYQLGADHFWKVNVPDGKGGQFRKQGFISKKDALEYAMRIFFEAMEKKGRVSSSTNGILFRDFSFRWLDLKKRNISRAAHMRYEQEVRLRLNPFFGHFKVAEIEKAHLRNYILEQQRLNTQSGTLKYSVIVFKSIIKQAELDDIAESKGINLILPPKHQRKEPRFWDSKQISYFVNAAKEFDHYELFIMTMFTGMRAGEIAGLKWDCIHLDRSIGNYHGGSIEIRRSYNQKTHEMQETTKNGDKRIIPILPEVSEILLRRYKNRKGDFVFGDTRPLDSSHFNRMLHTVLLKLPELPRIPFHGLRHSFCSYLDAAGMNRRIVAEIMGHRDLNTTNRYSHVSNQMLGYEVSRWVNNQNQQKSNNLEIVNS